MIKRRRAGETFLLRLGSSEKAAAGIFGRGKIEAGDWIAWLGCETGNGFECRFLSDFDPGLRMGRGDGNALRNFAFMECGSRDGAFDLSES